MIFIRVPFALIYSHSMNAYYHDHFNSPIGTIAISATEAFVTNVLFSDDMIKTAINKNKLTEDCKRQLVAYFEGHLMQFDLPLLQTGTPFQQTVWTAVSKIAMGETCSYSGIADFLKQPNLTRAIGAANGANKIAIIVPCHRVLGANGKLTGYAWGAWRKEWLLKHERTTTKRASELFDF